MDRRVLTVQPLTAPLVLLFAVFVAAVGNHTGRIKVVFTPTICKLTCVGVRCHNNCKLGNTTTIVSENGHATDTLTAPNFRVGEWPRTRTHTHRHTHTHSQPLFTENLFVDIRQEVEPSEAFSRDQNFPFSPFTTRTCAALLPR